MIHSKLYVIENIGALTRDWPRIPLPDNADLLETSAALGREVAALLDPESPVDGVTAGAIRPELWAIGQISRSGGGLLNPSADDLAVTARWGIAGRGGITMPSRGKAIERDYTSEERAALTDSAESLGHSLDDVFDCLGQTTYDVYLNDRAFWRNVPSGIWDYTIGGYQVIKKWLSYRERALLERDLSVDEARYVSEVARRIGALLLLQPALDANYSAVKVASYSWPRPETTPASGWQ